MKEYTGSQYSSQRLSRACLDRWPFCPAASTRLQRVVAKCPAGRTRALSSISICLTGDPLAQERIDDAVAVAVARDEVVANEGGERRLDGRWTAEAVACPNVARQELAAILDDYGAQHGALRKREPLPDRLEHRVLFREQAAQRLVQVFEGGAPAAAAAHLVPGLMGEALDIVRQIPGELHDRGAEAGLGLEPGARETRVDERRELVGRNFLEPHHRARLVKRALRPEHPC